MKNLVLISVLIISQLFSTQLLAQTATAPSSGDGTPLNPFQISSLENLYWLSQNPTHWEANKYFVQTADIDASATNTWFSNGAGDYYGFPRIGGTQNQGNAVYGMFNGNYDGQGHALSDLYINRPGPNMGLFGHLGVSPKTIKNLRLINPFVTVSSGSLQSIGILIGEASSNTTVQNVHIENGTLTVVGGGSYVGGMVGNVGQTCTFLNSTVNANISVGSGGLMIGGFGGRLVGGTTTFNDCSAAGTITASCFRLGGFVGQTEHSSGVISINRCYSTTAISNSTGLTGGFIGLVFGKVNFDDCYAVGDVTGATGSNYGGFYGFIWSSNVTAAFNRCYTTTAISGGTSKGGFGSEDYAQAGVTYSASFWNTSTSGISTGLATANRTGLAGRTTAQLQTPGTFTTASYDFVSETTNGTNDYWALVSGQNNNYPFLLHNIRVWTGASNRVWTNTANWQNGIVPKSNSVIKFATGAAYSPLVSSNITADMLDLKNATQSFDLGNYNLHVNAVIGYSSSRFIKTAGSGSLTMNIANNATNIFPVGNSTFNSVAVTNKSESPDDFAVTVLDEVFQNGVSGTTISASRVARTWNIAKANANSGAGIDLHFQWNDGETVGSMTVPGLYHYDGNWSRYTGVTSYSTSSLTYTGYTGTFSPFAIADNQFLLPVTWLSFTASKLQDSVQLKWNTAREFNVEVYSIQHSVDGNIWQTIGKQRAVVTTASTREYHHMHTSPVNGVNYYRIMQQDMDGKQYFSKTVTANFTAPADEMNVYPNPVTGSSFILWLEKARKVTLINITGTIVQEIHGKKGAQSVDISKLSKGIYILRADSESLSIIKQ